MQNRLQNLILEHWQTHRPHMVASLTQSHQLTQAVKEAEERAADLLYQFISVQKMQYQDAWELAMRECLSQPSSSTSSPNENRPATSA